MIETEKKMVLAASVHGQLQARINNKQQEQRELREKLIAIDAEIKALRDAQDVVAKEERK